ncbi:MotA/TolQ/ExbB proton channel family protein [Oxalobacter aliiformigenes]|uniref:MotA/TolQ/ExbB proton channel family protein n=1 Tax=Oxalobacter aliiformigenes TaxID=2946593 RepID=UPI0022AFD21E|nr:MotA/TolQ/ExbB proton channel family protein [Oxalobacter aliiformigenes]MCZ4064715.1 MotA/TolQ/ExbB proton channel family protein [Oxalobacter aliiformigenes]WAV99947.1 MotA/TolQ/ExbB proton channel family protein [Oxalobacter aliiformigenes]
MENNPYGMLALWNQGGWVIRSVAIVLFGMSVVSWTIIVVRAWKACKLSGLSKRVRLFWLAPSFQEGLRTLETRPADNPFHALATEGMAAATQYTDGPEKLRERMGMAEWLTENLRGCIDESMAKMQDGLSVLASIGATAPFIGLFGTVWGIYHALVSIGISGQASIDRIAGPVGESLVMTALGLAVAIPAVLGYNALGRINRRMAGELNRFARQLYGWFLTGSPVVPGNVRPEEN